MVHNKYSALFIVNTRQFQSLIHDHIIFKRVIDHREILNNLVSSTSLDPLHKTQHWKINLINRKTASFIHVDQIRILALFLVRHWILVVKTKWKVRILKWKHETIIIFWYKQTGKLRILNKQTIFRFWLEFQLRQILFDSLDSKKHNLMKVD